MGSLSTDVAGTETVVRVIKSPFHLTKNKLRLTKKAFHPPRGEAEFSVIRQLMTDDYCKDKGVELVGPGATYTGLASGLVQFIRDSGGDVVDKPEDFDGHAHVVNIAPQGTASADDPVDPETLEALDRYYQLLLDHFEYRPDPKPDSAGWEGPSLARDADSAVTQALPERT